MADFEEFERDLREGKNPKHISIDDVLHVLSEAAPPEFKDKKIIVDPDMHFLDHHFWHWKRCRDLNSKNKWWPGFKKHWWCWKNFKARSDFNWYYKLIYCKRNIHAPIHITHRQEDGQLHQWTACIDCGRKKEGSDRWTEIPS